MQMTEKRIPKKMLHTKMEGQTKLKKYRNERGKFGRNTRKQEVGKYRW